MIDRDTMLSDAQIDEIFNAMPGGPSGFLKSWGYRQFARAVAQKAAEAERERICTAIKAEDDHCVTEGDYMLDSDDCIKVIRGEWARPDYSIRARSTGGAR